MASLINQAFKKAKNEKRPALLTYTVAGDNTKKKSLEILKTVNEINKGRLLIISCGGIFNRADIIERSNSGADLFQLYTSFVFEGPKILDELL